MYSVNTDCIKGEEEVCDKSKRKEMGRDVSVKKNYFWDVLKGFLLVHPFAAKGYLSFPT